MQNNINVDDILKNLSEEERELALSILKEYADTGESSLMDDLKFSDFDEIPVSIDEFLDNDRYLGKGLWQIDPITGERKCTLFPYWRETLNKIFPDNITTAYNTFIMTGAIGLGKSLAGVLAMLYMLYRLLCLKDPYSFYGLQPIDKITVALMNITLDAAKGVAWDKLQQLLQSSEWFMSHGSVNASKTAPVWQPDKNIELIFGSNNRHIVGRALFCLDGDTEILTSEGVAKLKNLVDKPIQVYTQNNTGSYVLSDFCTVKPTLKTNEEFQIELEDGSIIKCTGEHLFRLKSGEYKKAKDLTDSDDIMFTEQPISYFEYIDSIIEKRGQWGLDIKSIKKVILSQEKQFYDVIEAAPYNNFLVKTNSGFIVSHNCCLEDEVNFGIGSDVEKKKAKLKKMISQIDARMTSRFMKGSYLPTLNMIISSKDTEQSFLDSYIETKRQNESKTTLIIDEPQWVVRPDKGSPDDPGAFYVAVGNKFLAHELLPVGISEAEIEKYREKGYTLMKVPPGFRENFEDNLDGALTDIAGISVTSTTRYISGVRLNQAKSDSYQNPFTKDIIEVGNSQQDFDQYSKWFDLTRVDPLDMSKPLFIHLDLSVSGDKTGIAGVWIVGKRPSTGEGDSSKELQYKLAFSVSIKAPKGFQISFEKNRNFIHWLKSVGFKIKGISSDTFQSSQIRQQLAADGFKTDVISVDRVDQSTKVCLPYFDFKAAIYERRLTLYKKCDLLTEELVNLERLADGHIDHPEKGSKDQADAVCGAMFLASKFAEEYSYSYGENLTTNLEINTENTDEFNKRQLIEEFEKELAAIHLERMGFYNRQNLKQQEEYQYYKDISDGIIVI